MWILRPVAWILGAPIVVALMAIAMLGACVVSIYHIVVEDFERIAKWVFDE